MLRISIATKLWTIFDYFGLVGGAVSHITSIKICLREDTRLLRDLSIEPWTELVHLELWFLCMCYVAYVLNRVSDPSLNNRQPIFAATGRTGDISALLSFSWLEPVYYKIDDTSFPSESPEGLGYWVGVAEHVGHALTYKIWSKTSGKILHRSAVRSAKDKENTNYRADPLFNHDDHELVSGTTPLPGNSSRVFTDQDYGEKISGRPVSYTHLTLPTI